MWKRMKKLLLCADFDETLTKRDTTGVLFRLAGDVEVYKQLLAQYDEDLQAFLKGYEAVWQAAPGGEFDAVGLHSFLEGYADVDLRSLHRVVHSRALKGIRQSDVAAEAKLVELRASCKQAMLADEWTVISANWSQQLVQVALENGGIAAEGDQVIANELVMDEHGVSTGEIRVRAHTPTDKSQRIAKLRTENAKTQPTIVYVGDSANDLLAMLEADVGIWLASDPHASSSKLLHRLTQYYGVNVHPLTNYSSFGKCMETAGSKPKIFTATDWTHIATLSTTETKLD